MLKVATIAGDLVLDDNQFQGVLKQSKSDMAAAALEMQRASAVKIDVAEWKKLNAQLQALQGRAHEVRGALLKAPAGSEESKKLQNELRGLSGRMRLLKAQTEPARKELERAARAQKDLGREAEQAQRKLKLSDVGGALPGTLGSVLGTVGTNPYAAAAAAVVALGAAATGGTVAMAKLGAELEMARVGFEGFLGSAAAAGQFVDQLREFAARTPFEMPGLLQATRMMMAFGFEANQVLPILRVVGDAAASFGGGPEQIQQIVRAIGQIYAKGKLSAEEMNQLTEAGISGWQMIADAIGVSVPEAMKRASSGSIDATTAINALLAGMEDRYNGGMERMSQTTLGLWSSLKDAWSNLMADMGTGFLEHIKPAIAEITTWIEWVSDRMAWMRGVQAGDRKTKATGEGGGGGGGGGWGSGEGDSSAPTLTPKAGAVGSAMAALMDRATQAMTQMRRSIYLNGQTTEEAVMSWELLNGAYAKADDATKAQLMALARQADAQEAARDAAREHADEQKRLGQEAERAADQLAGRYAAKLNEMVNAMRSAAGDMAEAMQRFADDAVAAVRDQLKRERDARDAAADEARAKYRLLAELGNEGARAMTDVVMFAKPAPATEDLKAGDLTQERIRAAAAEVSRQRQTEAAVAAAMQGGLFGSAIGGLRAYSAAQTPDMYGASSAQQVGYLSRMVELMSKQLDTLMRIERPVRT